MKYGLLLIINIFSITLIAQCPESIILCSQEDVDSFRTKYPLCTSIYLLEIDDKCNPIYNLDSLYEIEKVSILRLLPIDSLKSIDGFKNLRNVENLSFHPRKQFEPFPRLDTIGIIRHHFLNSDFDLSVYQDVKHIEKYISINESGRFSGLGSFSVSPLFSILIRNCFAESNIRTLLPTNHSNIDFFSIANSSNLDFKGLETLNSINRILISNSSNMDCSPLLSVDTIKVFNLHKVDLQNILIDSLHLIRNLEALFLIDVKNLYNIEQILPNLNSISWAISIIQNRDLKNIDLLDKFAIPLSQPSPIFQTNSSIINYRISIINNPNLESCNLELICKALEAYPDSVFISNNAGDCDKEKLLLQCISSAEDEIMNDKVQIVPNPSSNIISISSQENIKSVTIIDPAGRNIGEYQNPEYIDVLHLENGIYFVQINLNKGKSIIKKFVKI